MKLVLVGDLLYCYVVKLVLVEIGYVVFTPCTLESYFWVWQSSGPSGSDDVNFDPYPRHLHLIRPDDTSISGLTGSSLTPP